MRFRHHSPYLCEAFHVMATSTPPRSGSTDWGALLYFKLWRRLIAASIPPFRILPFCFSDGRTCRLDNRIPDPFVPDNSGGKWTMGLGLEEGGGLDQVLHKVFGVFLMLLDGRAATVLALFSRRFTSLSFLIVKTHLDLYFFLG
jgi:hypothetical protein